MSIRQERRAALRVKLIEISENKIAADGLQSVTARYLSKEAGCAVGAIYNIFEDMNELFMEVNLSSFQKLAQSVGQAADDLDNATPHEQLNKMGQAYLHHALNNTKRWLAMFEVDMSISGSIPDIYRTNLLSLMEVIATPMRKVYPDRTEEEISMIAHTAYCSIHGIVLLGVGRRWSVSEVDELSKMIHFLVYELGNASD